MKVNQSSRARGSNRGGCGGGYEPTDADYADKRDAEAVRTYFSLPPAHRTTFYTGLPKRQRRLVDEESAKRRSAERANNRRRTQW